MKSSLAYVLVIAMVVLMCERPPAERAFMNRLNSLHGKTAWGQVEYVPDSSRSPFWGQSLRAIFIKHSPDSMRIPFMVGADSSRTWVLTYHGDKMLFKHDHRHKDGTEDDISQYGGWSDKASAGPFSLRFPADEFTAKLLPAAATNEWELKFSEDYKSFYYILRRNGELRFRAKFYLN